MAILRRDAPLAIPGATIVSDYAFIDSPLGEILLISNGAALTGLHFVGEKYYPAIGADWRRSADAEPFPAARRALREFFAGERTRFDLPLAPAGTAYQLRVWHAIAEVPFAATIAYGELTARLGNLHGARAAGAATGRNPLSILIPCHRIVGADGALTGYAGGLDRKRALLDFEAAVAASGPRAFPPLPRQDRREPA
jgi:methylated-DNA-[protein]-cysteine S-methyltransferase